MKRIILASNNKHKIKEFKEVLTDYEILSLNDIGFYDDIVEDGETFSDNALIKCKAVSEFIKNKNFKCDIISDDSGLCCDALNGNPGVYSARYAGNHNDKANRDKLIKELDGLDKSAYFICLICLYKADGTYKFYEGKTFGNIIKEERGSTDFGYDCIFYSTELNKTFGEASDLEKNSVSHRGRAIMKLSEDL